VTAQVNLKGAAESRSYFLGVVLLDAERRVELREMDDPGAITAQNCQGGAVQALNGTVVLSCWVAQPPEGVSFLARVSLNRTSMPGWSFLGRRVCLRILACDNTRAGSAVLAVAESAALESLGVQP
jgi:hypothetical protein